MQHSIINCSCHAVHYILMTYLLYSWEFVPYDPLHPFQPPPHPQSLSLATTSLVSVSMNLVFCFFFLRFHIQVRSYGICLSLSDFFHLA